MFIEQWAGLKFGTASMFSFLLNRVEWNHHNNSSCMLPHTYCQGIFTSKKKKVWEAGCKTRNKSCTLTEWPEFHSGQRSINFSRCTQPLSIFLLLLFPVIIHTSCYLAGWLLNIPSTHKTSDESPHTSNYLVSLCLPISFLVHFIYYS